LSLVFTLVQNVQYYSYTVDVDSTCLPGYFRQSTGLKSIQCRNTPAGVLTTTVLRAQSNYIISACHTVNRLSHIKAFLWSWWQQQRWSTCKAVPRDSNYFKLRPFMWLVFETDLLSNLY